MTSTLLDAPACGYAAPDLDVARRLVALGVPVFWAQLSPDGAPLRPGWQFIEPDIAEVDQWRPGLALCATGGIIFDVLDVDPRHGGDVSIGRLLAELGDDKPNVYARVHTPSGGWHYWITALGIGKHVNFGRHSFGGGLDLQGGRPNGGSRGLAFLPPTVRPSKVTGELLPYRWIEAPSRAPSADTSGAKLAALIRASAEAKPGSPPGGRARLNQPTVTASEISAPYVRAAVTAELARVAEAPEGCRNNTLNAAAFALARFVAAGQLDADATAEALTEAAVHAGEDYSKAVATVRSAFSARGAA